MQKNVSCSPLKELSTWRKICLATWDQPRDPSVYGLLEVDMSRSLKLLESLKSEVSDAVTVTPIIVKIFAMALAAFPEINVLIRKNRLYHRKHVDIFVQVFTKEDGKSDLSGACIRDAHQKSLVAVSRELADQAEKIRQGFDPNLKKSKNSLKGIPPGLLKRALRFLSYLTFDLNISPKFLGLPHNPFGAMMITNVGIFGLRTGWAPLVPYSKTPTVVTVGEITEKPVAVGDQIVIRPILDIGFTVDHRIIDGYLAGKAAKYIKELFENPKSLLGK